MYTHLGRHICVYITIYINIIYVNIHTCIQYTYLECDPRVELQCHEGIPRDDAALKHHDAHALRLTRPRDIEQRPAKYNTYTHEYNRMCRYIQYIHT